METQTVLTRPIIKGTSLIVPLKIKHIFAAAALKLLGSERILFPWEGGMEKAFERQDFKDADDDVPAGRRFSLDIQLLFSSLDTLGGTS